ncbi:MAG: histidine kinase, partial [Actinomycetota bacterium]|nr:histidine kinase [Actinomycetota bacterium]
GESPHHNGDSYDNENNGAHAEVGQRPLLPRRQRQKNLAPQLRGDPLLPDWDEPLPAEEQNPDRVRDTMSAFQRGTLEARRVDPPVEP